MNEDDVVTEISVALDSVPYEPDMCTLRISGLKPRISASELGWGESTAEVQLQSDAEIKDLQALLGEKAPGKRHNIQNDGAKQARRLADWNSTR